MLLMSKWYLCHLTELTDIFNVQTNNGFTAMDNMRIILLVMLINTFIRVTYVLLIHYIE